MPAPKSERLLNLLIMLLVQRRPITKERIREFLYADSRPEAFEKMFERDKEELRSLGVPVEVAAVDPLFDDEQGYRIPVDEFALPDVELTPQEAAVVGLASRLWQHATLAQASSDAVRKLTAAGVDVDLGALEIAQPRLTADEPSFEACWEALCDRQPIEFEYARPNAGVLTRHLQPWGVVRYSGRWYVVGYDTDRADERVFRLSRIQGEVRKAGHPGAYDVPDGVDVRQTARRLAPMPEAEQAVLLMRKGSGYALRRNAVQVVVDVPGPDEESTWDRVVLHRPMEGLVDEVLAHGADAVLLEPAHLRQRVVSRLEAVVAG